MRPCPNGEARTENATTVERGFEGVSEIACNPSENPESSARRKSVILRSNRVRCGGVRRASAAAREPFESPLGQPPRFRPDDRERRSLSDFRRALSRLFPNSRKTERSYIEGRFRPFAAGFAKWMRRRRKEGSRRGGSEARTENRRMRRAGHCRGGTSNIIIFSVISSFPGYVQSGRRVCMNGRTAAVSVSDIPVFRFVFCRFALPVSSLCFVLSCSVPSAGCSLPCFSAWSLLALCRPFRAPGLGPVVPFADPGPAVGRKQAGV